MRPGRILAAFSCILFPNPIGFSKKESVMKTFWKLAGITALLSLAVSAQTTNVDSGNANAGLSSGTTLEATLTKSLDARKAKPGDSVFAKVTKDVTLDGKVVVR